MKEEIINGIERALCLQRKVINKPNEVEELLQDAFGSVGGYAHYKLLMGDMSRDVSKWFRVISDEEQNIFLNSNVFEPR